MKWMVEYHTALWCLQLPRSLYLIFYVCSNEGRVNGSHTTWKWRTPGIYTQLLTRKRWSLRGCSGLETWATPFPERSRGRFWDQLENPMMGRCKGTKLLSEKLLPTLRLMCSSKQTSSCQKGRLPSFFYSWTLDIKASLGQGSPCIGVQSALGKPELEQSLGAPTSQCSQRLKELVSHAVCRFSWRWASWWV